MKENQINTDVQNAPALSIKKQTKKSESFFYAFYFVGQNLIYWLVTNWLLLFYTNYAKITPAAIAIIFLVAKVWDAINDPIFGMIVDKTHLKRGKFVPWIKISSFLLPLATVLVFSIPSTLPIAAKIILAFVTYAVWDLLYTVSDVPIFALSTVMTNNVNERSNLVTLGRVGAMVGALGINMAAPIVIEMAEKAGYGMLPVVIGIGIIAMVTMIPIGFIAKERAINKNEPKNPKEKEHSFKEMIAYLKGNKYLLFFFASFLIHGIFKVTFANHVAIYLLGGLGKLTQVMIFSMPAMLLVYALAPILTKKFDRMVIYKLSVVGIIVAGVVQYFAGYQNFTFYLVMSVFRAFIEGFSGLLMFTFAGDALEYGHFKTGIRKEGITFSIQTFSAKFTAAIAGALSAFILALISFNPDLPVTEKMTSWIWFASCILPSLGALLSLPFLLKYNLKVKDVQIMSNVNSGKISREEGEKMLSRDYN